MSGPARPIGEDDLHRLVDGRLDAARRAEVEAYLRANPLEAARVAGWRADAAALRAALAFKEREPVPPGLDLGRLAAAHRGRRRWGTPAVAAGIAAALCLGAGGGWMAHRPEGPNGVTVLAREALAAHRLVTATGLRSDERAVAALDWRIAAPDLSASGYALLGRQPVVTDKGIGQILTYADASGRRISLFVRPMLDRTMTTPMQAVSGAPGWAWATDGLGVSLISSAPEPALHTLAEQVRRTLRS